MSLLIQILIDNKKSWIIPHAQVLVAELNKQGHNARVIHDHSEVVEGDIICLLGCEKKFNQLNLNKFNLVVHESDLPNGRGMSPFTWQILEGKSKIMITLLEAHENIDAGKIYDQIEVQLNGTELVDEWRDVQGNISNKLILSFIEKYPNVTSRDQYGEPSYFRKRTIADSKIDITKSIKEQFNLLRVVDNEKYPAWFEVEGNTYLIKVYKNKF